MPNDAQALVSVIVPVCNVQKYLAECLESILAQTHRELEVICINDGSKDASLAIMQTFAAKDPRVIVVDKPNEGYGATCNRGLEMAHGQWVSIIEPDDWIAPAMYEDMLAFAGRFSQPVDIVKTPWIDICEWDCPSTQYARKSDMCGRVKTSAAPFSIAQNPVLMELHPSIWSALYRTDFLRKNGIRFVPFPGAGWADNPFLVETLCQAKSIVYLDEPYYNYRCDLPGATLNHATDEAVARPFERWIDMMHVIERLGITDTRIIAAHYVRAFNYTFGAIHDDGWDNPVVKAKTREVFGMMDPELVKVMRNVAPHRKRFFFEERGLEVPRFPMGPWVKHLSGETVHTLKNDGLGRVVKRAGRVLRPTERKDI